MKVFADGAMYTKPATWTRAPADVVRTVGDDDLPSRPLVEYEAAIRAGRRRSASGSGSLATSRGACPVDSCDARCQLA